MKISRIVFVCLVLFVLSLSISFVYALWSNLLGVVTYGVVASLVSFAFLYYNTSKFSNKDDEYCFNFLFRVLVVFVLLAMLVCIGSAVYVLVLICVGDEYFESIFYRVLDCVQILCLPFLFIVMEAAIILALKDAKDCKKMRGFLNKSSRISEEIF